MDTLITIGVCIAYGIFYTAFSKTSKRLELGLLLDVVLVRRSLDHTLVELNKLISLAGLTLLSLAPFLGSFYNSSLRDAVWWQASVLLVVHSCYSVYKYYGESKMIPAITRLRYIKLPGLGADRVESVKFVSIALGCVAQLGVMGGIVVPPIFFNICALVAIYAGITHFYSMEIDYKGVLQVRPFAYLPFTIASFALYKLFRQLVF